MPEFGLGDNKWTIWEQYEQAPNQGYKKGNVAATWAAFQKVAWFTDIVTFWQLWQSQPFSNLEKYFFDKD